MTVCHDKAHNAEGSPPPLPVYTPPVALIPVDDPRFKWAANPIFDEMKFWFAVWKEFREETGHWPVLMICFYFIKWVPFVLGGLLIFYAADKNNWSSQREWTTLGVFVACYVPLVMWLPSLIWRFEWRRGKLSKSTSS